MSSQKQIEANRRNGNLSNGPKTTEGKLVATKNALKHGLFSREVLLPNEDGDSLADFAQQIGTELQPHGELERSLVERIIELTWRLRRVGKIEAGILIWQYCGILAERAKGKIGQEFQPGDDRLVKAIGSENTDHEKQQAVLTEQRTFKDARTAESATLGQAFIRDSNQANALSKLSRYETSIERSLYKAIHELQRLQAARHGENVPPPQAIDIDVTGLPPSQPDEDRILPFTDC